MTKKKDVAKFSFAVSIEVRPEIRDGEHNVLYERAYYALTLPCLYCKEETYITIGRNGKISNEINLPPAVIKDIEKRFGEHAKQAIEKAEGTIEEAKTKNTIDRYNRCCDELKSLEKDPVISKIKAQEVFDDIANYAFTKAKAHNKRVGKPTRRT